MVHDVSLINDKVKAELQTGLEQSGDTIYPRVVACRRLRKTLEWISGDVDPRDAAGGTPSGDGVFTPKEIISGAARPCGGGVPPVGFDGARPSACDLSGEQQLRMVAHPGPVAHRLPALVTSHVTTNRGGTGTASALVAIGPEGGWTDEELGLLEQHGFLQVSIGERPLTTSTATVAILAMVAEILSSSEIVNEDGC